jgi:GTP-dependent phosphoenolpyruvate carboxykinase
MDNNKLVKETLQAALDYSQSLTKGILACVEHLREGDGAKALGSIPKISEDLLWISKAIQYTSSEQKYTFDFQKWNQTLSEINDALENLDYNLLADLLEYEVSELLNNWYQNNL